MNKEQILACVGALQLVADAIDVNDYGTYTEFNLHLRTSYQALGKFSEREVAVVRMVDQIIALADELKEIRGMDDDGSVDQAG